MSPIARQAFAGLLRSLIAFAALLFIPAWSLWFWQGWAYIAIMAAGSAAIILYLARHDEALLARRLKAGPVAEREKSQRLIQTVTAALGVILFLVPGFDHHWRWSQVPMLLTMAGFAAVALGFVVVFLAFRENSFGSGIIEVADDQKVVASGPYAVVRHPMYVGAIVLFLGTPLALGSYWALIPAVALSAMIAVRLTDEERFLAANLPGYDAYRRQVRYRLAPGLW